MIKEHIKIIQDHRKTPREFLVGSAGVLERLRTRQIPRKILDHLDVIISAVKKSVCLPQFGGLYGAGYGEFLKVVDVKNFIELNGFDLKEESNLLLFIDSLECEMDPEKSYKRLFRRMDKMKGSKFIKYQQYMGKELKKKMDTILLDFQVLELFLVFFCKKNSIYVQDKKFNRKLTDELGIFVKKMKTLDLQKPKKKQRTMPMTQKDLDLINIKEIKRIKMEKEAEKKRTAKRIIEE